MIGRVRLAREAHAPVIFSGDGLPEKLGFYTKMKPFLSQSIGYLIWLERRPERRPTGGSKTRTDGPPWFPIKPRITSVPAPLLTKCSRNNLLRSKIKSPLSFPFDSTKNASDLSSQFLNISAISSSFYTRFRRRFPPTLDCSYLLRP